MRFQTQLVPATLIRRYKRFLADCVLEDGREIVAHCANPGAMTGLSEPGTRIWLEPNDDPKRKLDHGWRLVDHGDGNFTGVDTALPNRVVGEALAARSIPGLETYSDLRAEVAYAAGSRVDFLLTGPGLPDAYLEVKSVTLSRDTGLAEFPDTVTARGARHLAALAQMARAGHRAIVLYLVQRTDCTRFCIAADIDPAYATNHEHSAAAGVESLCFRTDISPDAITLAGPLTFAAPRTSSASASGAVRND